MAEAVPGDDDAMRRFIERFTLDLTDAGVPRMPARVFVALFATDSGSATAAELAEMLQVSPASISGAVRYLAHVDMITRHREPGSRSDHYRIDDDVLFHMVSQRERIFRAWRDTLAEGLDVVGPDGPAGARMAEMHDFLGFMSREMPELMRRWRAEREARVD